MRLASREPRGAGGRGAAVLAVERRGRVEPSRVVEPPAQAGDGAGGRRQAGGDEAEPEDEVEGGAEVGLEGPGAQAEREDRREVEHRADAELGETVRERFSRRDMRQR